MRLESRALGLEDGIVRLVPYDPAWAALYDGGRVSDYIAALSAAGYALRADPVLRDAYAALKESLARRYPRDRPSYIDAKTGFVRAVVAGRGSGTSIGHTSGRD